MNSFKALFLIPTAAALLSAGSGAHAARSQTGQPKAMQMRVLSSRPDMITDGSALVRIDLPADGKNARPRVTIDGNDVTDRFHASGDGSIQGLVTGLKIGRNTLVASLGGARAGLVLTSHSHDGPIISGPHQQPWICETADFSLPDGSTLGPPQDADCNAPTRVLYLYMPVGSSSFKVMPSATAAPPDVRKTTTSDGRTVDYIVRLETGTLNRGVYQFAVLYDPMKDPAPSPAASYQGWNRRIVFTFGGSAMAGYAQGKITGGVLNDMMLSQGYAVISSSLNVFGNDADDVLSAESASMTIEKFKKEFGESVYIMGWGSSGGSMQQHLIANNYPGILDGITPGMSFADLQSILPAGMDCSLMSRAFSATSESWTDAQKAAVSGYRDYSTCAGAPAGAPHITAWEQSFSPGWVVAKQLPMTSHLGGATIDISNCHIEIPKALIYDPVTNPKGARCSIYDNVVNQMGIDPATGHAARALDNVGVQYGLKAFRAGMISPEQFVELNEKIGGYDSDGNFQVERSVASDIALANSYAFGRVNEGWNLANIPIIDYRFYADPDAHNAIRSLSTRARLIRTNGSAANQIILRAPIGANFLPAIVLKDMDRWLTGIASDTRVYSSRAEKVLADKPSDVTDACYTATGEKIAETPDPENGGRCGRLFPYFSGPRMVAGGPLTDDVLKCRLRPIDRSDYAALSDDQFARLQKIFPNGVCDYSKPSIGYQPLKGAWLKYTGPGEAQPLTPAS